MQKFRQGLEIWGLQLRQGGASGFLANLLHSNTADRNYTLPDKAGTIALISDVNKTGFPNRTSTTLTWNTGTRTITLAPTGSNFTVSVNGTTYTKTTQTSTIPNVTGGYFIYFDNTGTLQQSTTPWNILTTAPIAYVYWDSGLADGFAFEERHGDSWSPSEHYYHHMKDGTEALSGFAATGYDKAGAGGNATNAFNTYAIATGEVADEDIILNTSALADGGPYTIFNRTGATGTWTWTKTNTIPFKVGTTFPQYNQWTGATWQMTEGASLRYINYFVYATTSLDSLFQYIIIPGQNIFTSLALAQAETYATLQLGTLPFQEIVPLYQITLRTGAGVAYNGATGSCRIEDFIRITGSKTSISQAAITNHEGLVGLLGGDSTDGHFHLNLAKYTEANQYATTSLSGHLSSTDWNTFNGKQAALNGTGLVRMAGTVVSYDNTTYATDSLTAHLAGTETFTGIKIFNNGGLKIALNAASYSFIGQTYSQASSIVGNNIYVNPADTVSDQVRYLNTHASYGFTYLSMKQGIFTFYGASGATTQDAIITPGSSLMSLSSTSLTLGGTTPIIAGGYVSLAGNLIFSTNTSTLQGKTTGAVTVNLFTLTSDTNNITRFIAGVDAGGFQWTNQAQSVSWMTLSSAALAIPAQMNVGTYLNVNSSAAAIGYINIGTSSGTQQNYIKIYGNLAADNAPLISFFRTGNYEATISLTGSKLKFGINGGLANYLDATLQAVVGLTLDTAGAGVFSSSVTATSFVKTSGTSAQFLKADGSVDSSTYSTTAHNHTGVYQPLATNLTSIGALANAAGYLYNNGSGIFSYGTPTITTTDDTTTNAYFPIIIQSATGSNPLKTTTSKLTINPSTGYLQGVMGIFSGGFRTGGDRLVLWDNYIANWATNANDSVGINQTSYQGGATQFRDLIIYDGKGATVATFTGSAKTLTLAGIILAPSLSPLATSTAITLGHSSQAPLKLGCTGSTYPYMGYNVNPTSTNNAYTYAVTDTAAMIQYGPSGGLIFNGAASGTAATAISFTTMLNLGLSTAAFSGTITSGGIAVALSGGNISQFTNNSGYLNSIGLLRNSLSPSATLDSSLTASNFRTKVFGSSTAGYQLSTSRWDNSLPTILSGLSSYGTMIAWAGSDTHGFLALNYATQGAVIGGGNADLINWTATLITSANIASQAVSSATTAGTSNYVNLNYSNDSNSTYQMLWGSSTSLFGTAGIYCNPYTDILYAADFSASSDIRLKENIKPLMNALQKVLSINGVYYNWNSLSGRDRITEQVGVIAQDVLKVLPQAVIQNEEYMSVSYGKLVPLLIEAIKEQQEQIEELKKKIA